MSENVQEDVQGEVPAQEAGAAPISVPVSNKRWYVVHAYSGMEKSVQRALTERVERAGMQDQFGQILVPTEEVVEVKNGQKSVTERRFFPGYVLVEMEMTDALPIELRPFRVLLTKDFDYTTRDTPGGQSAILIRR